MSKPIAMTVRDSVIFVVNDDGSVYKFGGGTWRAVPPVPGTDAAFLAGSTPLAEAGKKSSSKRHARVISEGII